MATANFLMVVSLAVLAHDVLACASDVLACASDVLACAGDVSMGITIFPIGWIYSGPFEKLRDG